MKVLSIDHSFKRTGYSFLDDFKLLSTGSFELGKMTFENVLKFENNVNELIERYKPDIVITEKPAHMRNVEIARMLTSLHTSVILCSLKHHLPFDTVNPKAMKKAITGDGGASKTTVCESLVEKYGYDIDMLRNIHYYKKDKTKIKEIDYDESDSVANAIFYLINNKGIEEC